MKLIFFLIPLLILIPSQTFLVDGALESNKQNEFEIDIPNDWKKTSENPLTLERSYTRQEITIYNEKISLGKSFSETTNQKITELIYQTKFSLSEFEESKEMIAATIEISSGHSSKIIRLKAILQNDVVWYIQTTWNDSKYFSDYLDAGSLNEIESIESSFRFTLKSVQSYIKSDFEEQKQDDLETTQSISPLLNNKTESNENDFLYFLLILPVIGIVVYFVLKSKKPRREDPPPPPPPTRPDVISDFSIQFDNSQNELSHVTLSWIPPKDNHSEITNYLIQFKNTVDSQWNEENSSKPQHDLKLKKGFKYQFRIASENDVGKSDFSPIQEKFFTSSLLDTYQQDAVSFPKDQPLLVAAGPGSGKTRVVAERVKDLILNQDLDSDKILCMTFSKSGRESMEKRLEDDFDFKQNKVFFNLKNIRTIHSFCYDYLKKPPVFIMKATNDNDGHEKLGRHGKIWNDYFKKHPEEFKFKKLSNDDESFEQLIDAVSAFKRENKSITDLENYLPEKPSDDEDEFTAKLRDLLNYWKLYEKHLSSIGKKDFDDFLQQTNDQLNKNDYKENFDHLIIDEFQDTNYLQFEIIKKIIPSKNITVVGDKNQSIYSFQGASVELYNDFAKHFKNYSTKQLVYNYRSTPQIVKTSNNFLESYLDDSSTALGDYKAKNPASSPVHVREFPSIDHELEYIFKLIISNINNETIRNRENRLVTFSDFVILTRTNEMRLAIRQNLVHLGIPCESKGFTTIEYKEKFITKSLGKILDQNNLSRNSLISELIDSLKKDEKTKFSNLQLDFEKKWSPIDSNYIKNIFLSLANEFHNTLGDRKISEFLLYFDNPNGDDKYPRPENWSPIHNAVKVKTTHSVKGEEFPYVIIVNSVEDHFPLNYFERELKVPENLKESYSEEPSENLHLSEESRLFYVGLSRPKNELFITYSLKNNSEELIPSRFLHFLNYLSYQENLEFKKILGESHISPESSFETNSHKTKNDVEDNDIDSHGVGIHFFAELLKARNSISICSPWISKQYAPILVDLSKKNKKIKIITFNDTSNQDQLETIRILKENKNENLSLIITDKMVHSKIFIKDKTLGVYGSANFTFTGMFKQHNRVTIVRGNKTTKILNDFDKYWEEYKHLEFS